MSEKILVIDDDNEVRNLISGVLSDEGFEVAEASNESEAFGALKSETPDLIFLDLWINDDESAGLKILKKIKKIHPFVPIVIISGHGTVDIAVKVIRHGAFDFIEKPFVIDRLLLTCQSALELSRLKRENTLLKNIAQDTEVVFVGESQFVQSLRSTVKKISETNCRVFIQGNAGVCADTIAKAIHDRSERKDFPFVYVNCDTENSELLGSELFGSEKNQGAIEKANFGTLYLDEVTKIPRDLQRILLQFLLEGKYNLNQRNIYADVRLICNTTKNIDELLAADEFNRELFLRLNIVHIDVPNLCDRREDILPLIEYYLSNSEVFFNLKRIDFSEDSLAVLQFYDWSGNLRQLKNVVECSLINAGGRDQIGRDCLPAELIQSGREKYSSLNIEELIALPIKEAKEHFEANYILAQIDRFSGNISKTAEFIGMERSALHRKIKGLNLTVSRKSKN